jgi:hypothetical protein
MAIASGIRAHQCDRWPDPSAGARSRSGPSGHDTARAPSLCCCPTPARGRDGRAGARRLVPPARVRARGRRPDPAPPATRAARPARRRAGRGEAQLLERHGSSERADTRTRVRRRSCSVGSRLARCEDAASPDRPSQGRDPRPPDHTHALAIWRRWSGSPMINLDL